MNKIYAFILILICSTRAVYSVDMFKYTQWIYESHPFFISQKLDISKQEQSIYKTEGVKDWSLNGDLSHQKTKPTPSNSFSSNKIETYKSSLSVGKTVWKSGAKLRLFTESQKQKQNTTPYNFSGTSISFTSPQLYQYEVGISYTHPLLKNRKGTLIKIPYKRESVYLKVTEYNVLNNNKMFILSSIEKYLNWVLYNEVYQLTSKRLKVAHEGLVQLKRKYKAGLIEKLDVLRQEDSIRAIKQELVSIKASIDAITAELSILSSQDISSFKTPKHNIYIQPIINKKSSYKESINYKLCLSEIEINTLEKKQVLEERKSNLDLSYTYGLLSGDASFEDSFAFDKYDQNISILYTKKLYNRSNKADLEKTELKNQQLRKNMKINELNFNINKSTLLTQIRSYKDIIKLSTEQIESATQTVKEELKLYDLGKGNLTFVIQARENQHKARIQFVKNLIHLEDLSYQYLALTDQLLPHVLRENQ